MLSDVLIDFKTYGLTFASFFYGNSIDLHGRHCLREIRGRSLDVDFVANCQFTIRYFQDANTEMREIMGDGSDQ